MRPAARLLWVLLALTALALLVAGGWLPQGVVLLLCVALAVAAVVDAWRVRRRGPLAAQRQVAHAMSLGVTGDIVVRVENTAARARHCRFHDHTPASFDCEGLPASLTAQPDGWAEARYSATPTLRGTFEFPCIDFEEHSSLGLWWRRHRAPLADTVRVYPNVAAVTRYAQMAAEQRLDSIGVHRKRRRGEGLEFHQLRDYRPGDALARIDWRATARTRKLITREYQEERDQAVVFLLDCGRRMRSADGVLSHFDEALNALLLLSYVALRQGDAVGAGTFSGTPRWVRPRKGLATMGTLLNELFELQPGPDAPDYARAVAGFAARQSRRTLVVVLTNARDEDTSELTLALAQLRQRHVVLLASLRERALDDELASRTDDLPGALRVAATHDYLARRDKALAVLRSTGIRTLDATPEQLSVELVNRYLTIKAEGIL